MVVSEATETEYELDIGASLDKVMEALKVYISCRYISSRRDREAKLKSVWEGAASATLD